MASSVRGQDARPRIAVVIGSGSMKAAASMGMWEVLREERIPVDMVVGCSGGAIYAAHFALGGDVATAMEHTVRRVTAAFLGRLNWASVAKIVLPRLLRFRSDVGLRRDDGLWKTLRAIYGEQATFGDTQIPLYLVATDRADGSKVILSEGRIIDAVRASTSLPMVWPPWPVGDRLLIDGGTSDPLPVDVAMKEGGDVIIAMGLEEPYAPDCRSLGELAHQTIAVVTNNLLRATYSFYNIAHHSEVIPIIPTFDRKIGTTDGHLGPYLAERGREATLAVLPQLRRLLDATTP